MSKYRTKMKYCSTYQSNLTIIPYVCMATNIHHLPKSPLKKGGSEEEPIMVYIQKYIDTVNTNKKTYDRSSYG